MPDMNPTPDQIAAVQANLTNMQDFNDYVFLYGSPKVTTAYLLLSEVDAEDPGVAICLNILESALNAIGGILGPAGSFVGTFFAGMINSWTTNTPPSLNTTFASLLTRLSATSLAVDDQVATINGDVADNWNTSFTFGGNTTAVSDLAAIAFPAKGTDDFQTLANAALFALDQAIWSTVLQANFIISLWQSVEDGAVQPFIIKSDDQTTPPITEIESYIAANPAFYYTYSWHVASGCGDSTGWAIQEYNLGTGVTVENANNLSLAACAYLFTDSADGVIINSLGLYPRETVFTGLGLRNTTWVIQNGGTSLTFAEVPATKKLSFGYLRAMKEGRTLGQLIAQEGREAVEQRVIEKAHADHVFARDLQHHPRHTLETFLGVKIPEVVDVHVTVETPRRFGLVIPMKK